MGFVATLNAAWRQHDSMLCVGLDPDRAKLPDHLRQREDGIFEFCRDIVDACAGLACAYKPQIAYFSSERAEAQLERLIEHIKKQQPGVPVILDAKRGDIGATAQHYAKEVFERYCADAVTVSPYMGFDSMEPYLNYRDRGVILLCRTSNPGGDDLQMLDVVGGEKLFEQVARLAAGRWNTTGELGLVVGATYPAELRRVRLLAPTLPLLVPGIGAQGGDLQASVAAGIDANGYGMIVSSSRQILFASKGRDFASAAARVAADTRNALRRAADRAKAHNP